MDAVILDASGRPVRQTGCFDLDLAYGDDENRFTLSNLTFGLSEGMRWIVDGSPYGGIVDDVEIDSDESSVVSYGGRSLQGILAAKIVQPDAGQSHLVVSGEANSVIAQMLDRCSVEWLAASSDDSGISVESYRFHRYVDLWSGLRMMLASCGARLMVRCVNDVPVLSAVARDSYGDVPGELVSFTASRSYRPVNHLIGLGTGEGADREVVHWYADASGSVSRTQTLFGLDEVCDVYDLSSESEDLSGKTRDKLAEMQGQGTFEVDDLPDDAKLDVGDVVTASCPDPPMSVEAEVVKVIVKVDAGEATVSREVGSPSWPDEED